MTIPGVSAHARERMVERHGRDLTREEWCGVVLAICDRRATLICIGQKGSGDVYDVTFGDLVFRVVWQPCRGLIVTVLGDGASVTRRSERVKRSRLRKSFRKFGGWKGGERLRPGTEWR